MSAAEMKGDGVRNITEEEETQPWLPESCKCDLSWYVREQNKKKGWCVVCLRERWAELAPAFAAWVRERRARYFEDIGVPKRYCKCGLDNFVAERRDQQRALAEVGAWAARLDNAPRGLFLQGPAGTGKTHLAVAALLELFCNRRSGQFVSVRELLLVCRESFRDGAERVLSEILEDYTDCGALVLDDLGAEKVSEFARADVLLSIVDRAYAHRKPLLIVTSNLTLDQIGAKVDERVSDRLREMCQVVRLIGPSYRRGLAAQLPR